MSLPIPTKTVIVVFVRSFLQPHRKTQRRPGFTVLELMIALALLGGLLAVAWSILGSYRMAEQRGWDQAYRMQVVRAARELLETDVTHWHDASSTDAFAANPEIDAFSAAFAGDETGFTVVMLPSLDPLPWLEQITAGTEATSTHAALGISEPAASQPEERRGERIDGPLDRVRLRYEIVRDPSNAQSTAVAHLRRQLTPLNRPTAPVNSEDATAADRLLTVDDLYRRNPSDRSDARSAADATLVRNLIAPRFRYSDGSEWFGQWDAREHGGLPRAIELSFDHPQANSPYRVTVDQEPTPERGSAAGSEPGASLAEPDASLERDVRIVVHVPDGVALSASNAP